MSRRAKILIIGSLIAIGAYFGAYLTVSGRFVPSEFSQARLEGARIATEIVGLSNGSLMNLQEIAKYDAAGNTKVALALIGQEFERNRKVREEAIKLASRLETMARYLSQIKPDEAQALATEAVSSEVALVSHLLVYNDTFRELFEVLREKFQDPQSNPNGRVKELIEKVNNEARAINDFDQRFNQSLAEFDKLF